MTEVKTNNTTDAI